MLIAFSSSQVLPFDASSSAISQPPSGLTICLNTFSFLLEYVFYLLTEQQW